MSVASHLLTDEQMRQFISRGYVILRTALPKEFYELLNAKLGEVMEKEGNPGNNLLPRLSEINDILQDPVVRGGLTSVVGENYAIHPHRHCHFTYPGRKVQHWHKDSYWGHQKVRNHHNWWAMIFYYPQAVDEEMGPSGLLSGSQYYTKRAGDETEIPVYMEGPEGTFALIHYDLWHRGMANNSQKTRAMMKFQFVRMDAPTRPAWNNRCDGWLDVEDAPFDHNAVWAQQWRWHRGQAADGSNGLNQSESGIAALGEQLASKYEPNGVDAAYRLAANAEAAIPTLAASLTSGNATAARNAGYGLSAIGLAAQAALLDAAHHESEETRMHAVFALGELGDGGSGTAEVVAAAVSDPSVQVRRAAVEALGLLKEPADVILPALIYGLNDEDGQARFTSALSLQRLGSRAAGAVPPLKAALSDENRYVRANSVDALRRVGTPEALEIAFDYLSVHRWCPLTTPDNLF
ncbi:MAG: HEAT repeat domain-containing protein [Caldilineaceae bacterium]|nr:HEAT repeat domain-containing protein [Caldilineaceae bacterium]